MIFIKSVWQENSKISAYLCTPFPIAKRRRQKCSSKAKNFAICGCRSGIHLWNPRFFEKIEQNFYFLAAKILPFFRLLQRLAARLGKAQVGSVISLRNVFSCFFSYKKNSLKTIFNVFLHKNA